MRALVVYESMYGNTHLIANAIAEGLRAHVETVVVPVGEADTSPYLARTMIDMPSSHAVARGFAEMLVAAVGVDHVLPGSGRKSRVGRLQI